MLNEERLPQEREFHLGTILSVVKGVLLTPDGSLDSIYDILNFMIESPPGTIFANQIKRVMSECAPYLIMRMRWLEGMDATPAIRSPQWKEWLDEQVGIYGEYHSVIPIHPEDHENISPGEELRQQGFDDSDIHPISTSSRDNDDGPQIYLN